MKFEHEFYQVCPGENIYSFYRKQRHAKAILEVTRMLKRGYYEVRVVDIVSDEEFSIFGAPNGYQFAIGDIFTLRRHKHVDGRSWYSTYSDNWWYDPRYAGQEGRGEGYRLIEN